MRGLQVLAWLCLGACAQSLTIPSPRKQDAVDATTSAREVAAELTTQPSQEQGFGGPRRGLQAPNDLCGEFVPVAADECPANPKEMATCDVVACGELCEGDGEYTTVDWLDNCGGYDVYRKSCGTVTADTCGELVPVAVDECPANPKEMATCDVVACGELCEGDGECCTDDDLDNCGGYDVYRKSCGTVTLPATCGSYSVSGSKSQSEKHGLYVAKGECNGKTLYECVDCSSPPGFLFYSSKYDDWNIGSEACGRNHDMHTVGSSKGDLGLAPWTEWSGSEWVETPTISVRVILYSVSGTDHQSTRMGTYIADGTCDGKTLYMCHDCSSSHEQKLWYNSGIERWLIGDAGCGESTAALKSPGFEGDPGSVTQWQEVGDGEWVDAPTVAASCVAAPPTCESYSVSGSKHRSHYHGTYVAKGECEGSTAYECVDCSSPATLFYFARYGEWEIGPAQACRFRHTARMGSSIASNDPSSGQWKEYTGSEWVKTPTIKVKCEGDYLNLAAIVEEAVPEASTPSIAMMLVIVMLCCAVVAFLHFPRKQPRKNADETPLLDKGGEAL